MTSVSSYRGPTHRDLLVDEVADRLKMESDIIGERWRRLKAASSEFKIIKMRSVENAQCYQRKKSF